MQVEVSLVGLPRDNRDIRTSELAEMTLGMARTSECGEAMRQQLYCSNGILAISNVSGTPLNLGRKAPSS
jgi:hypothetical protein